MSQPHNAPAFRQLQKFIQEKTAPKPRRKAPKSETANSLTSRIIETLRTDGHFAGRINTTGIYDESLRKYRKSGATLGVPDIIACVSSSFVGIEIKVGQDRMSEAQQRVSKQVNNAGGWYVVACTFADFEAFYAALTSPPFV